MYPEPLETMELRVVLEPREQPESLELRVQRDLKVRGIVWSLLGCYHYLSLVILNNSHQVIQF